ncbi:MAG TPA: 4-alpha-glucanotransferase, partial [Thermomicrobiaceae bacterium]|nr:4-alpha-glucanotransferase [Thermomicrobiaceae bacterium]
DLAAFDDEATDVTDYSAAIAAKSALLKRAFRRWTPDRRFETFAAQAAWWLEDYATFEAASEIHDGHEWWQWEPGLARYDAAMVERFRAAHRDEVNYQRFVQYIFTRQWSALRSAAQAREIELVGDVPIYVAHNSADVWANQQLFHLDAEGQVSIQAGVPPDYFSKTGQLWGNPCYRWDVIAEDGYRWWVERFRRTFELVDIARVDHFRGFVAGWQVPSGEKTAIKGRWVAGPGQAIFRELRRQLGDLRLIVEDLGLITADVDELRLSLGYPGMHVLQFGFDGDVENSHLPHNYERNSVVYTGTHDNDTAVGWFTALDSDERQQVLIYVPDGSDAINWDLIRLAWMSVADTAIAPLQDFLGLGSGARFNTPGVGEGNWRWRLDFEQLTSDIAAQIARLTATYGRCKMPRLATTRGDASSRP